MDTPVFFHQNTYKHRHKHSFHFIQAAQVDDSWCPKNGYPDARYNVSTNGWGDGGTFNDWFLHHFVSNLKHEKRPILLITDGYKSHISTKIIKIALDHHVHVECLPPHSTTLLQPLDVVTLSKVAELFKNSILPSHCASGFLKSGFYPYDPPVISKEKLLEPPTVMTSFSYQHVACSNSIDKSFSNFNYLALRACPSTTRLSSCPNILLTGPMEVATQTSTQCNLSSATSKSPLNCLITTNQVGLDPMTKVILYGVTNDISIGTSASFNTINTLNLINVSMVTNTNNNQALTSPSMCFNQNLYADNMSTFASTSKHCVAPPPVTHLNANASNNSCEISSNDYSTLPPNQNDKLTTQTALNSIAIAIDNNRNKKKFLNFDNEDSYSATADRASKPKEVSIATPVSSM
ncbi:unnamed protein product [Rotaria magnacalcarata]|uniref:DDE-1 domain-containing protein n=1 Tax=Rotaria magnacalcarata TaxID=392030 RepID=A0A819L8J4_9BILA|nr:unnamed protein product [Rotaria magnacalcarata]